LATDLPQFLQLPQEPQAKWAFRPQFLNQQFGLIKCGLVDITAVNELAIATLHFGFGQQVITPSLKWFVIHSQ
jgi:hypothetical protein